MKKIFVDLDSTLTDFPQQLADLLDKPLDRDWDFGNDPKIWKKIDDAGDKFWADMKWMPDGHDLWDYLKDHPKDLDLTILTAPSRHPSSKAGKREWMKKNLPDTPCIIDEDKDKHAKKGYILIDDREKNINKWEDAGGTGILHKNAKDTIKKLKKIMEKEKESSQNVIVTLRGLSEQLKTAGRHKEAYHLNKVADRWEDFLRSEGLRGSPGTTTMEDPKRSATPGMKRNFFPDRILVNLAQDTLKRLKDQKASIIAEKIRELNNMDVNDPATKSKKIELMSNAQSYSPEMVDFISALLSLRYDNKDRNKIREVESEMKRLSRKMSQMKGMGEERPGLFGEPARRPVRKDPFVRTAGTITINPYDAVVQEAVQEIGPNLKDVDVIQLEANCPGDKLAWVSNKDLLEGRPGKEKVIHLCLKKIKDNFKAKFGKEYSAVDPSDNLKMKELVKTFLVNVILPHEHVHIQQELSNQGMFGPSPEPEAEKAEDWKPMEQFGIKKAMVSHIDRIASQLESKGMMEEAYNLDVIANTFEKDASLELYYTQFIDSVMKHHPNTNKVMEWLARGVDKLYPVGPNEDKQKVTAAAWKKALSNILSNPKALIDRLRNYKIDTSAIPADPEELKKWVVLHIAKALGLKSGYLAENTMPLDDWAKFTGMSIPEFARFVDTGSSSSNSQTPPSNDGNPVKE